MSVKTSSATAASIKGINQSTKKHLRGSTLLLAGRFISMATNFAVQVLIVRYLSKSDYGAFAYVMSLVSLGSSLVVVGLDKTVTRFLPIYQEKGEYHKLFGTIIMMVGTIFSLGFFLVLLVFGMRGWIAESFINDQMAVRLLLLMIFLSPISALDSLLVGMLAIFAKPSAIFFRRHVLGPGLKLMVVLALVLLGSDVFFLATGNLVAGALGVSIYSGILIRDLRNQKLGKHFNFQTIKFPIREIFGFSIPLLTTNFVYLFRSQLVVVMLEYFRSTLDVAAFRAVLPVADLNTVVIQSFGILFMPMMARMFAKEDQKGIDDLYWHSAIWITIISFPIFLVTFSLAQPLTLLLFGERYAQSGLIMATLAFGYYFNAALGFNADTLRVHGRLRYTVTIDILAMFISAGLSLILIPRYGALGAAIGTFGTLVLYNILNHVGLKFATKINLFQWRYLRVYASITLGTLGLVVFQSLISPPIYIGLVLAGFISLTVLLINRNVLNVEQTFPELLRFQLVRLLFGTNRDKQQEPP
jgi:O-antigen/teichoic acid export membrane protein